MTAQTILGVDPGAHGAIAVLDEGGDLLDVVDMPSTPEGNGRSAAVPVSAVINRMLDFDCALRYDPADPAAKGFFGLTGAAAVNALQQTVEKLRSYHRQARFADPVVLAPDRPLKPLLIEAID